MDKQCEYNARITDITLPEFPFNGEVMNVKFTIIEGNFIFGTASVRENSFHIKFEIIK